MEWCTIRTGGMERVTSNTGPTSRLVMTSSSKMVPLAWYVSSSLSTSLLFLFMSFSSSSYSSPSSTLALALRDVENGDDTWFQDGPLVWCVSILFYCSLFLSSSPALPGFVWHLDWWWCDEVPRLPLLYLLSHLPLSSLSCHHSSSFPTLKCQKWNDVVSRWPRVYASYPLSFPSLLPLSPSLLTVTSSFFFFI